MKRIGLYLAAEPNGGGAFQYSMTMLEAVAALPKEQYVPIVAYSNRGWFDILSPYGIETLYTASPFVSMGAAYAWRKLGMPIGWWRKLAASVDPPSRRLLSLNCDLCIYPAQDPMAYMLPVPALGTVHDLMHRYEGRFREVAGYRMRELHYRATCRYAKGVLVDSETGKRQLAESYGIEPERIHPLPYVPPSYMHATEDPQDLLGGYHLPPKFFFIQRNFGRIRITRHCSARPSY